MADPQHPDRYFVATDVGVYQTLAGGTSWSALGQGLPNVVVTSLALHQESQELFAGTYGRSVFSVSVEAICLWDLTGDGSVAIDDLLILLQAWGSNPGHPADFDGDGSVGISDLLALLANWGACP